MEDRKANWRLTGAVLGYAASDVIHARDELVATIKSTKDVPNGTIDNALERMDSHYVAFKKALMTYYVVDVAHVNARNRSRNVRP